MGDMIWHPRFGELEAEREVVLEEIAMYEDDPQDRVFDGIARGVFGDHELGRPVIGRAEVISAVTRERLARFHAGRYAPESIVVAAAGSVDHDALVELALAAIPQRLRGTSATPVTADDHARVEPPGGRVGFLVKDTEQYHVCIGGLGIGRSDERRFALRVLEGILGGTTSSRLFQEIRERRGLAYSVFSFSNLFAHTGEVGIYLGTRPENLPQAIAVIAAELERCVREPARQEELDRSRENLKGRVVLSMESTAARMSYLGGSLLNRLPILSVDELIERIESVQMADLKGLAAELYSALGLSVAGVGPDEGDFLSAIAPLDGERRNGRARPGRGDRAESLNPSGAVATQPAG